MSDLRKTPVSLNDVAGSGQMVRKTVMTENQNGVTAFSIKLDNSAGGSAVTYRIFDGAGIVNAIDGSATAPTSGTITPSVIAETTKSKAIVLKGFNYQVSSSSSQFSQPFNFKKGNIDGRVITLPNVIAKARRNTQFDSKLLTIDEHIVVDYATACEVTVDAGETVDLTFLVEGFLG